MVDADLTYDFGEIPSFVRELDDGAQLVIGNRMQDIKPGAMPLLSRLGNPLLSGFLNVLHRTNVHDAHCGMRALRRDVLPALNLRTVGMEFASEMVIRATREHLDVREVPIALHPRVGDVEAVAVPRRLAAPPPDPRLQPDVPLPRAGRGHVRRRARSSRCSCSSRCRSSGATCSSTR